jgi:iron complex outermembrane recepter protein
MKLFFVLLFLSQLLLAQSDTTTSSMKFETEEVVVTATRMNQKSIDVPFAVYNLNMQEIKHDRKISVSDVLGNIPGVFMQSRYGNHDVRISIRGFGSRSNSGIRGVRILLDGIPESEPDGQTRIEAIDFNAVGNIEVVKGNSSSLYTNAPGGVINFVNNFFYPTSFLTQYNEIGSFGLRRNGLQFGMKSSNYNLLTTYTYHSNEGFRSHSQDYWHVLNTVFQTFPTEMTRLEILGYFVNGLIKLPGSLTKAEFEADPFQPAKRETDYDFKRISKKGRVAFRFNDILNENNEFEVTGYGTIKYFERAQRDYRIMNRYGIGGTAKYIGKYSLFSMPNILSAGGDLFYQTGPVENYPNINGSRRDDLQGLTDETISNIGFYLSNNTAVNERLSLLLTARFDKVIFDVRNQLLQVQNTVRSFHDITPKAAVNYKITPSFAVYGSYGMSFDSPAGNELDDYPRPDDPGYSIKLINPNLNPQESLNAEVGVKGYILRESEGFLNNVYLDLALFNSVIKNEIVPFEVLGDVFYRNSAKTNRRGIEFGLTLDLLRNITVKSAVTYNYFRYSTYSAYAIVLEDENLVTRLRDYSGNTVPSVPQQLVNTEVIYRYPLLNFMKIFLKGNHIFAGSMYVNDSNTETAKSYSLINGTVGFDFYFNPFNILLTGSVNNITDEVYTGFININSANRRFYEPGEPRSYYMALRFNYIF